MFRIIFLICLFSTSFHINARSLNYKDLAWGSLTYTDVTFLEKYEWPFNPLSIGHTMSSYQQYDDGAAYFHHALDIMGHAEQEIFSSTDGKVINIEKYGPDELFWEVAILDDNGFIWQYHHVDRKSITDEIHESYKWGMRILRGTKIGEIVRWPYPSGSEKFHHLHINVLDKDKNYINPFIFLKPFVDNKAPEILKIGLLKNGHVIPTNVVSEKYGIYTEVRDLIHHDRFYVPPYLVKYSINGNTPVTVWKFDQLPGGSDKKKYINDFFVPDNTCGNYSCRKFFVNLGFVTDKTLKFPTQNGEHEISVTIMDYYGNKTTKKFKWEIQ
ncbi:MAG: peptidoglycan DD-metalloendopeptidase family protein [Bacteriovoracaceae bacterium]|nr:peptidoglycan DD-metalloendopeptidase family protein [Bacteriovoracaceae bacterium]